MTSEQTEFLNRTGVIYDTVRAGWIRGYDEVLCGTGAWAWDFMFRGPEQFDERCRLFHWRLSADDVYGNRANPYQSGRYAAAIAQRDNRAQVFADAMSWPE